MEVSEWCYTVWKALCVRGGKGERKEDAAFIGQHQVLLIALYYSSFISQVPVPDIHQTSITRRREHNQTDFNGRKGLQPRSLNKLTLSELVCKFYINFCIKKNRPGTTRVHTISPRYEKNSIKLATRYRDEKVSYNTC